MDLFVRISRSQELTTKANRDSGTPGQNVSNHFMCGEMSNGTTTAVHKLQLKKRQNQLLTYQNLEYLAKFNFEKKKMSPLPIVWRPSLIYLLGTYLVPLKVHTSRAQFDASLVASFGVFFKEDNIHHGKIRDVVKSVL